MLEYRKVFDMAKNGGNTTKIYEGEGEGVNSKATLFVMRLNEMSDIDNDDFDQVKQRVDEYFELCLEFDTRPLVTGLASALGMDRRQLWMIANDKRGHGVHNLRVTDLLKKVYDRMETIWEFAFSNGKINPVSGIFLGQNYFGYESKTVTEVRPQIMVAETTDRAELIAEAERLPLLESVSADYEVVE